MSTNFLTKLKISLKNPHDYDNVFGTPSKYIPDIKKIYLS